MIGGWEAPVRAGGAVYFAAAHERVAAFCDRHFSVAGAAALHGHALGWDLARAPANVALAIPALAVKGLAWGARQAGADAAAGWLGRRNLVLRTAVAREIDWLIRTELLILPMVDGDRVATRDALAEAILGLPQIAALLAEDLAAIAARGDAPEFRAQVEAAMLGYGGSRAAAAEITTALLTLGAGAAALHQATPGMLSLGPALAGVLAQQAAVASFPLGAAAGGLWYGAFPAAASPGLIAGATGGLMLVGAVATAFAGMIADPVQRALGMHQRRLHRMIDALAAQFAGDSQAGFVAREPYVARLGDLVDLIGAVARLARG